MNSSTSRIIIETMIRRAIKEMQDSPKRTIRNLIDMALEFSNGRFQQHFFKVAQTMLKNENSPYYDLAYDVVSHVDTEHLVTFGINVGFNGCTLGAKKIREIEAKEGFNVPWSVVFKIKNQIYLEHQEQYDKIIQQGENLGIFTWQIFAEKLPELLLPFTQKHPTSAFVIFCNPEDVTRKFIDYVAELNNVMLVIRYNDQTQEICDMLRKAGRMYSVYYQYTNECIEEILNGDLFYSTQQLHPAFTVLIADSDCSSKNQEVIYTYIRQSRDHQTYQTIPWELVCDNKFIDSIISNDVCLMGFDENGYLYTPYEKKAQLNYNLFHDELQKILQYAFPKQ